MKIIGWIRHGDQAACGGLVAEGAPHCTSGGRTYSFEGARMDCQKNCVIADGYMRSKLPNGRAKVIHGMLTSGGCPLQSTLNEVDGVGNQSGREISTRFVQNDSGDWLGMTNEGYDQHFMLTDAETGIPLANRHYRMTCNGRVFEGRTDSGGKTEKVTSDQPAEVIIEIMPEGYREKF